MPRILYDYQAFGQLYGGVSRYFYELIWRIAHFEDMSVLLFQGLHVNRYPFEEYARELDHRAGFKVPNLPKTGWLRSLVNRKWLGHIMADPVGLCQIYHPTYYRPLHHDIPELRKGKLVITVYDMIHEIYFARVYPNHETLAHKRTMVKEADAIFTISHQTKRDLVAILGVDPSIVFVTPLASSIQKATQLHSLPVQIGRPFLLYVGKRDGYKNFELLLRAYLQSADIRRELDLVCFGSCGFRPRERALIREHSAIDQVKHIVGDDNVLAALYQAAFALIYPSLYEGFGLPALEAMTLGCPVITTRCGAIPEVVGEAGIYFDELDAESLQASIRRLMTDDRLRFQRIEAGMLRAKTFSWDRTAMLTAQVYRDLI